MQKHRCEIEVKEAIRKIVHKGTPVQVKELSRLICGEQSWSYKRQRLLKLIASFQDCLSPKYDTHHDR